MFRKFNSFSDAIFLSIRKGENKEKAGESAISCSNNATWLLGVLFAKANQLVCGLAHDSDPVLIYPVQANFL